VIVINDELSIPENELTFTASRSGGPGGQNVNKVSSRVTLTFDLEHSPSLSDDQRRRIAERLKSRVNKDGLLRVVSQRTRSQELNREDVVTIFTELLRRALTVQKKRVKTRVPQVAHARRLEEKKKRTIVKAERRRTEWD
jgi:ribosome-associated protein